MSSNNNRSVMQWLNLVAILAMILVNILANALPINGRFTYEISDSYPNLFTPPGFVFSIWFVIYVLLITFAFYQFRISERDKDYLKQIGPLYVIGCLINIFWIFIFHYSYGNSGLFIVTELLIAGLLIVLLLKYVRLGIGIREVPRSEKLGVHLPVSVYLGWISLATIASTASVLNLLIPSIPLDVQQFWTAAVIVIALLITILMIVLCHDFGFALVVIWASYGIASANSAVPIIFFAAAGAVVVVALLLLLYPLLRKTGYAEYYKLKLSE
ncbi:MAG: tryptophan-rich sensory protein [Candidatus Thorarchaeota archaeon]|nr:tryptophan-rich sensory protein [Candidatus Thorarchaeota archaeon]